MTAYRYGELSADGDRPGYHFAPLEGVALLTAYAASRRALAARSGDGEPGGHELDDDVAVARMCRRFEVRGRLGDAAEDVDALVRLWFALAQRCGDGIDVRDVNCMLKLGDRVSQLGVDGLAADARAMVRSAVEMEGQAVEVLFEQAGARCGVGCSVAWPVKRPSGCSERGRERSVRSFGMLLVNSSRSRAYVDALVRHGMMPAKVVLVSRGPGDDEASGERVAGFDNVTPVSAQLSRAEIETQRVEANDVNDPAVAHAVSGCGVDVMVYSGFPGVKVKPGLLRAGAELLHVHGGRLPGQRGSTTWYYSLLQEGQCWASAIVMTERLDGGSVVAQRAYVPGPEERTQLDHGFDPLMRADLLCRVMRRYFETGMLARSPQPVLGTMHYVMHPVLRHVASFAGQRSSGGAVAQRKGEVECHAA